MAHKDMMNTALTVITINSELLQYIFRYKFPSREHAFTDSVSDVEKLTSSMTDVNFSIKINCFLAFVSASTADIA